MRFPSRFAVLCMFSMAGNAQSAATHNRTGNLRNADAVKSRAKGPVRPEPAKKFSYQEPNGSGGFDTVESDHRCVLRTKVGTEPPLVYLYDIQNAEALYLPTYAPESVVVTDRTKDIGDTEGTPFGEFDFKLEETAESVAKLQRLKKELPKVREIAPAEVALTTVDWEAPPSKGFERPSKVSLKKWNEKGAFHFTITDKDTAILLKSHENRESFRIAVHFKTECGDNAISKSPVAYHAAAPTHRMHYEHEDTFVYPKHAVDAAAKLITALEAPEEKDTDTIEKKTRELLQLFAKTPTEKDAQMVKAFGYKNTDEAINDVLRVQKTRLGDPRVSVRLYCQGYQSCLAGLLYDVKILQASKPARVPANGRVIDILDEEKWAELLDAVDGDAPKAFANLAKDKRIIYAAEQVTLLKKIEQAPETPTLRRLKTRIWDRKHPDKPLVERTDDTVVVKTK